MSINPSQWDIYEAINDSPTAINILQFKMVNTSNVLQNEQHIGHLAILRKTSLIASVKPR